MPDDVLMVIAFKPISQGDEAACRIHEVGGALPGVPRRACPEAERRAGGGKEFGLRGDRRRVREWEIAQGGGNPAGHGKHEGEGIASGVRAGACRERSFGRCGTRECGFADAASDSVRQQGSGVRLGRPMAGTRRPAWISTSSASRDGYSGTMSRIGNSAVTVVRDTGSSPPSLLPSAVGATAAKFIRHSIRRSVFVDRDGLSLKLSILNAPRLFECPNLFLSLHNLLHQELGRACGFRPRRSVISSSSIASWPIRSRAALRALEVEFV